MTQPTVQPVAVIPFGAGVRVLRSPEAESLRLARISLRRVSAYHRAVRGGYGKADLAMFGPAEDLMRDGPRDARSSTPPIAPTAA